MTKISSAVSQSDGQTDRAVATVVISDVRRAAAQSMNTSPAPIALQESLLNLMCT